jgi:hypothetical protein
LFFLNDADLSIIVEYLKMGGFFEGTVSKIEESFEFVVPAWGGRYQ